MVSQSDNQHHTIPFMLLSLAFHSMLFFMLSRYSFRLPSEYQSDTTEVTVHIELDSEEEDHPKNAISEPLPSTIVSPSEIPESKEIPLTNQLSDKTTRTDKEQIRRGDPLLQPQQQEQKSAATPAESRIKNIFLDKTSELFASSTTEAVPITDETSPKQSTESAADRIQKFVGMSGNSDYLPHIPDGELTMLNAKADRFAVFVRRVALQVFSSLRTSDWTDHPVFQKNMNTEEVVILARMSKDGTLISAHVAKPSNHPSFDKIVLASVQKGTWDKNPPEAALADDGTVRFIFKSKAWVRQSGGMRSRKWILLGTGLE
jgi:TonB family protein